MGNKIKGEIRFPESIISARGPDVAADEAYPYNVELTRRVREEPING